MIKVDKIDICVSNMCDAVHVHSPSRVYMEIGAHMAEDTLHYVETRLRLLDHLTTAAETGLKEGSEKDD